MTDIQSAPDSLQIRALIARADINTLFKDVVGKEKTGARHGCYDSVSIVIAPLGDSCSAILVCEPTASAWRDWLFVDHGANLENTEAISRAISRRLAEHRRQENVRRLQTATDKELAVAKLGLLHAQIEPHFLYNTLGSAKYLVQRDAVKAEAILDNLIAYLRDSLPRVAESASTLGDELRRAQSYLDILRIRMGERLATHIDVPEQLREMPFPNMMLQTLVENAIKHGLEPKSGGGNVWILANVRDGVLAVTVADDGVGLASVDAPPPMTAGTNVGLNNVRERLKLAYGDTASLDLVANFPSGVAATIRVPSVMSIGASA